MIGSCQEKEKFQSIEQGRDAPESKDRLKNLLLMKTWLIGLFDFLVLVLAAIAADDNKMELDGEEEALVDEVAVADELT